MGLGRRELRLASGVQRLGAVAGLNAGLLVADTFSAADGTDLTSRRPDTGPTPAALVGAWDAQLGRCRCASGAGQRLLAYQGLARADVTASVLVTCSATTDAGLAVNVQGAADYWLATLTADTLILYLFVAGNPSNLGQVVLGTQTGDHRLGVVTAGDTIAVLWDGAVKFAIAPAGRAYKAAAAVGLRSWQNDDAATRFDNLLVV